MNLNLHLSNRQRAARVCLEQISEQSEFRTFNIDLEDVDKVVSVYLHELGEGVHRRVSTRAMFALSRETPGLEVRPVRDFAVFVHFGAEL